MKKLLLHLIMICLILQSALCAGGSAAFAASYMSNKTEIPVNLEISGAEALC